MIDTAITIVIDFRILGVVLILIFIIVKYLLIYKVQKHFGF
jgi:hypothetical protein